MFFGDCFLPFYISKCVPERRPLKRKNIFYKTYCFYWFIYRKLKPDKKDGLFCKKGRVGENALGGFKKMIPLTSHFNENSDYYAFWCRIFHSGGNFPTRFSSKRSAEQFPDNLRVISILTWIGPQRPSFGFMEYSLNSWRPAERCEFPWQSGTKPNTSAKHVPY